MHAFWRPEDCFGVELKELLGCFGFSLKKNMRVVAQGVSVCVLMFPLFLLDIQKKNI